MKAKGSTPQETSPKGNDQLNAQPPRTDNAVSTIEMSGVLASRMIHELTNHLTVIAGNLQVVEMVPDDPELAARALGSVRQASMALGEVVDRYASFRRQLRNDSLGCDASDFSTMVKQGPGPEPFDEPGQGASRDWWKEWDVIAPASMKGWLPIEARWINYAIWRAAGLSQAPRGQIRFFPPGSNPDLGGLSTLISGNRFGDFLHIAICWAGDKSALDHQELHKPSSLALAVVIGLVRWVEGQVGVVFLPPDENRLWISLPIEKRREA